MSHNPYTLILEYIKEAGPYVLATPDDADFFRSQARKGKQVAPAAPIPQVASPTFVPQVIKQEPLPTPSPIPAPAVLNKKAPPQPQVEESLISTPKFQFSSMRTLLSTVAPHLSIINTIPSDATACKISERWKTKNKSAPISILTFQEPKEQKALLEQIACALDIYFGPAKIIEAETIEKERQWEAFLSVSDLKMIIVCDYTLWQLSSLMHFYKETPAQGIRTLSNTPLFLLPDLSLYLKDPLLKRSLWKALCQKFS